MSASSELVLHQFAVSHFCEKARWALDLKGLGWRAENHVPGLHARPARRLAGQSSLPVLELGGGEAIGGSTAILERLEALRPEPRLTPTEPALAEAARAWERRLDEALGVAVRRLCYATLLEHRELCLPLLAQGTPWYGKPLMHAMWSRLVPKMRAGFGLTAENVARARDDVERTVEELAAARDEEGYLVGGRFTRADLTAAAMLAPLTLEPGYGARWPAPRMPDPLGSWCDALAPRLVWVSAIYAAHRRPSPAASPPR